MKITLNKFYSFIVGFMVGVILYLVALSVANAHEDHIDVIEGNKTILSGMSVCRDVEHARSVFAVKRSSGFEASVEYYKSLVEDGKCANVGGPVAIKFRELIESDGDSVIVRVTPHNAESPELFMLIANAKHFKDRKEFEAHLGKEASL